MKQDARVEFPVGTRVRLTKIGASGNVDGHKAGDLATVTGHGKSFTDCVRLRFDGESSDFYGLFEIETEVVKADPRPVLLYNMKHRVMVEGPADYRGITDDEVIDAVAEAMIVARAVLRDKFPTLTITVD